VSDPALVYEIPMFEAEPAFCSEEIVYKADIEIEGIDAAITFTNSTFTIEYLEGIDIAGTDPEGTTYPITVSAVLGDQVASEIFDLTFKNPCIDTAYMSVVAPPLMTPPEMTYTLYETDNNVMTMPAF
jgi:hypothetical protein